MRQKGFIFSLDAFVAFTLSMMTISLLLFAIGTPKPFYQSLEQSHQLSYDTLRALASSSDAVGNPSYLEQIMADNSKAPGIMMKVAGGDPAFRGIIPSGFGYRLEQYSFNSSTPGWSAIFDAGAANSGCLYFSDRCGKSFTKLQSSATTFASMYEVTPAPGDSPYCYLSCNGYQPGGGHLNPCNATPCNISISNFQSGQNSIRLIRLVVYT